MRRTVIQKRARRLRSEVHDPTKRLGLNLGNHSETVISDPTKRLGMNLGNHNETLVADAR